MKSCRIVLGCVLASFCLVSGGAIAQGAPQTLTVVIAGIASGTVTSIPAGINCSPICTAQFPTGSVVTLIAEPAVGSVFLGWSGSGCSGIGACVVTMSTTQTVAATFLFGDLFITVSLAGTGNGTINSMPGGVHCPLICLAVFPPGTVVTLTAVPAVGSTFSGWSGGGCTGTGTCVLTNSGSTVPTATFTDAIPPSVTITGFPPNPSSVPNPQFTFASNESQSTFTCQLDGGTLLVCTSPTTVSVAKGNHTFTVIATDPAGNPSVPAIYSWTAAAIGNNTAIPTLDEWMLMLLALIVGSAGLLMFQRRKD
jgi:IPTL-CTERM motif/Divergent InlB B-repeat domain